MKKSLADKLAYEMALKIVPNSKIPLGEDEAADLAKFIQALSSEFQTRLDDFEVSVQSD